MAGKGNPADTADGAFRKFWIRLNKPAQEQHKGPAVGNNPFGSGGYMPAAQRVCFAQQQTGLAKGMRDQGEAGLE